MSSAWIDAVARALARARSRRGTLFLLLNGTIGAIAATGNDAGARRRFARGSSRKSEKKRGSKRGKHGKG